MEGPAEHLPWWQLSSGGDVAQALAYVGRAVLDGVLDARSANAAVNAFNALLVALRESGSVLDPDLAQTAVLVKYVEQMTAEEFEHAIQTGQVPERLGTLDERHGSHHRRKRAPE